MMQAASNHPAPPPQGGNFLEVEQQFYRAMEAGDADTLDKMMTDECVYLHSFGSQDGKASYLQKVRGGHFRYRGLEFTQQRVMHRGNLVIVVGTMSGAVSVQGLERKLDNVRISVWENMQGQWKLLTFQPTPWLDK